MLYRHYKIACLEMKHTKLTLLSSQTVMQNGFYMFQ